VSKPKRCKLCRKYVGSMEIHVRTQHPDSLEARIYRAAQPDYGLLEEEKKPVSS
jgi:hypothetical protein